MKDELLRRFSQLSAAALASEAPPAATFEALALVLAADAAGRLGDLPSGERAALLRGGGIALLRAGGGDDEDEGWAIALARAGRCRLSGEALPRDTPADPMHPPAGRLLDMLRGAPDGLSAGASGAHVLSCEACQRIVAVLRAGRDAPLSKAPASRLKVAAAGAPPMRAPAGGCAIASLDAPEVEAVLFDQEAPRRLAVYSALGVPLRFEAEGVVTEHMLSGYWVGRIPDAAEKLDGVLHVDDRAIAWSLPLGPRRDR